MCDAAVVVPTRETARIQELHITVGHLICLITEAELCAIVPPPIAYRPGSKEATLAELVPVRGALSQAGAHRRLDQRLLRHPARRSSREPEGRENALATSSSSASTTTRTWRARRAPGAPSTICSSASRCSARSRWSITSWPSPSRRPPRSLASSSPTSTARGSDYAPPNGAPIPEAEIVRAYGGRIEFLPLVEGLSTTSIAARLG